MSKHQGSASARQWLPVAVGAVLGIAWACGGLAATADGPAEVLIRGVGLVDVREGIVVAPRDIVVRGTEIVSLQPSGGPLPRAKTVIDGRGKYAFPGLVDAHVHLARFTRETAASFLVHGVTAVRDMGTDPARIVEWRRALARGQMYAPRIARACGPMLEGRGERRVDHWLAAGPAAADAVVDRVADAGMDCVKVRTAADAATYRAIAAAARRRGLPLVGHEPAGLSMLDALAAGQRTFEHAFYPYPLSSLPPDEPARIAQAIGRSGAALVPTLVAWRPSGDALEVLRALTDRVAADPTAGVSAELVAHWRTTLTAYAAEKRGTPGWRDAIRAAGADVGTLQRLGATVLAGTDTGAPFVEPRRALHEELSLLVSSAGLTPAAALRAATLDAARVLDLAGLGDLRVGGAADIVVTSANPLEDIRHSQAIDAVVFRGEVLTRAHLNRLARAGQPR